MATAELSAAVVDGVTGLEVPWWGWTALALMIFWGLLGPSDQQDEPQPDRELFPGHR